MKLNMFDAVTYSAVQGKKIVILLRVLEKASAAAAALVPFGTTDSENISADSDTTVTTARSSQPALHPWNCPRKR